MRKILHLLTRPEDSLFQEVLIEQRAQPGLQIEVMDLTQSNPDYQVLLETIFDSDSVQVW